MLTAVVNHSNRMALTAKYLACWQHVWVAYALPTVVDLQLQDCCQM